uniref:RRM domain-containing protein n=1 Tax=Wuchereria bancrofti TaxID=6293 RepID=A0AAF5PJV5_WUCBA
MAFRERDNAVTSAIKTAPSITDRSARSIFVGNISYEVGEEQLKQVFSQVGTVVHLRLVHDRDTGKWKGYRFFANIMTLKLNLNGFELNGHPLRVDSAAGDDRSADEVQQLQAAFAAQQQEQQTQENPYDPETEAEKAPEAISRSVASLPPEQMFELMKQMKQCVHNNPNEAKNLLMNNPQLVCALLQVQVVMRIIDPQVAIAMLHRETPAISQPHQQQQTFPEGRLHSSFSIYGSPIPHYFSSIYAPIPPLRLQQQIAYIYLMLIVPFW